MIVVTCNNKLTKIREKKFCMRQFMFYQSYILGALLFFRGGAKFVSYAHRTIGMIRFVDPKIVRFKIVFEGK